MSAIPISPGEPLSVNLTVSSYADPTTPAVDPSQTVTATLSPTPHGAAVDPACVYTATEIGPASGNIGTIYNVQIPAGNTTGKITVGSTVYLVPSVNGAVCDPRDVVMLQVVA